MPNIGAFGENFPYTNFHDMNQDWMIKTFKQMQEEVANGESSIEEVRDQVIQMIEHLDGTIDEKVEQAISDAIESGDFTEIIASVANENIFYCVNPTMTQGFIQNIINTHSAIKFRPGTYNVYIPEINDCGYLIPSNRIIFFDNVTIKKNGNYTHDYDAVIKIEDSENVILYGNGTIDYNREFMQEETGEHGMCLSIGNSSHISIDGLKFINAWGDGIYLNNNHYIYINNVFCDNNKRNGIAIIAGEKYRISNSYFINSIGTAPESGIAIENNYSTDLLKDILVENCTCYGNNGTSEVYVTIKSSNGSVKLDNIRCETPIPVTLTGDNSKVFILNSNLGVRSENHVFNIECQANNEIHFINCEIDGKGIISSGSFIRYTGGTFHNLFIENCFIHDLTLSGRAVLGLGTRENVDRIVVDCKSNNFNIPTPVVLFQTAVTSPFIKWSIDNMDEKELVAESTYPFKNYYISANTKPGNSGLTYQEFNLTNRTDSSKNLYAITMYLLDKTTATTLAIPSGAKAKLISYKSNWIVITVE